MQVRAQTVPLPSVDAGRLRERIDLPPETERPLEQRETAIPQGNVLPESMKSARVTLKAIRLAGATVLAGDVLQAKADSYTGREISGGDILELASSLTAMYRNAGYILSMVVVPEQSLESGLLTLNVIEGYIGHVSVRADAGVSEHLRTRLVEAGEKIKASRPLDAAVLERYLLIANDLPGVTLRSVLAPSQLPGAADLTLVASVKKSEGFVAIDNHGSRYLGPGQVFLGLGANQLLGVNDQWRFTTAGTGNSEMSFSQIAYSQVLNVEGLKLSAIVSSARTRPGDVLKPFDVHGNADTFSAGLSYPILRTRNESLFLRATYDHADIHTDILGTRVVEDHVRALRLGLSWRVLDRMDGQNTVDLDFSQGLGGTQASDLLKSRTHHGNVDVGTLQDDNSADKYKTLLVDELEATTANDYIRILSAFFDYVHSNSAAKVLNPWSARIVKGARNQAESYEPFSNQELKKIFKAELYRAKMKLPDFYWGPLVALYTGARAEEIASLTPAQVLKEKGIVYIQILQGKTENAPRRIPVHDALVDLGFLEYVTLVRKAGFPLLFPHLIDGKNGFKKNMTRRHTAITALTNAQVNDGLKKALVGHDGKTKTSSHDDYVHLAQLTLPNLSRAINLLNFPIDLVGLRADSPSLLHAAQRRIAARKAMDEKKPLAALKR
ncbi:site-specific recombinase, phage integrase family [Ostertagia ostertagi]